MFRRYESDAQLFNAAPRSSKLATYLLVMPKRGVGALRLVKKFVSLMQ